MNYYLYFWLLNCIITIILITKYRKNTLIVKKKYFKFLTIKWKIITITIATIWIIIVWIISGDPTWDVWVSIWISLLYFYTSPYVIWILYRFIKWLYKNYIELYISIIILLFSSSWFYDWYNYLYLLWHYPESWTSNFIFSLPIYILAWMFWSLGYKNWVWVIFSFSEKNWIEYKSPKGSFKKIYLYIWLISLLVTYIFWYFLYYFNK